MRRLTAALALGLMVPRGARPAVLERVEVVEDGGPVVRLHVSEPVKPVAHALAGPDRIYLDLPVTATAPAAQAVTRGVGPLLRVRMARFDAGTVRVVLDLAAAVPFTLETDARTVVVRLGPGRTEAAPPPPASQPEAAPAPEPAGPPSAAPSASAAPSLPAVAPEPETKPPDLGTGPPAPRTEPPDLRAEPPAPVPEPPRVAEEAPRTAPEPSGPGRPPVKPPGVQPPLAAARPPAPTDGHGSGERALPLVIIDPGHGGHDPGAAGVGGVIEKDVVLDIARRLAVKLATRLPVSVVLTRLDDSYVPIERRVPEAAEAALFLSLHANACHDPSARGVEVFYGGGAGAPGDPIAADRAMRLGRAVESALATVVGGVRGDARPGTFAVLARNAVPGVLVEIGYLTHPGDAARACDGAYQDLLTDALVEGVRDFLRVSAPVL
ncbi:MAG: N-acetylmuramoyl-L-alanine amidase [Deltaproteobacteria bacterium]|nr:MAG: N-acetylmuramoyl-L-alanine amidase [Deltaproteobacteria bacterium]TMA71263.1 MAG: N-acetylmuramoyl-L-alanine amidase [Deltaproteobacteria bacterium]